MGIFVDTFKIDLKTENLKIEKQTLGPVTKSSEVFIKKGLKAIINGKEYLGLNEPYKFNWNDLVSKKGDSFTAYVFRDQLRDNFEVGFYVGEIICADKELRETKLKYAVVCLVELQILNYNKLIEKFGAPHSDESLLSKVRVDVRESFSNICKPIIDKYNSDCKSVNELALYQNQIFQELRENTIDSLKDYGLHIAKINNLKFNPREETEYIQEIIRNKINENALDSLNSPERKRREEELEKQRQYEIELEKAKNAKVINIVDQKEHHYCYKCGKEIERKDAAFCSYCGAKLKEEDK